MFTTWGLCEAWQEVKGQESRVEKWSGEIWVLQILWHGCDWGICSLHLKLFFNSNAIAHIHDGRWRVSVARAWLTGQKPKPRWAARLYCREKPQRRQRQFWGWQLTLLAHSPNLSFQALDLRACESARLRIYCSFSGTLLSTGCTDTSSISKAHARKKLPSFLALQTFTLEHHTRIF